MRVLIISAAISALLSIASQAFACSCVSVENVKEAAARSSAVFIGWVVALELDDGSWSQKKVRFRITTSWKGTDGEYVTVKTGMGKGDCGVEYELGSSYRVFARGDSGKLFTSICASPRKLYTREEFDSALGEPRETFDWHRRR